MGQLEEARRRLAAFEKELVKRGRAQQRDLEALIASFRYGNAIVRQLVLLCLDNHGLTPERMTAPEFQDYLAMSGQD